MLKLNILHLLAILGAVGAAVALRREARGRSLTPGRLFLAPTCALGVAFLLLALTDFEWRQPQLWLGALGFGLAAGAMRGWFAPLEVDRLWDRVRVGQARDGLWTGYLLGAVALAAMSIDVAVHLTAGPYDLLGNLVAALCAGFLSGRAALLWLRSLGAPHATSGRAL
ncbi:MAG: hypothetical protein LCH95_16860 [Proteobacteria bacterium]|nr:hypothetical protein [Pseudomonadota bacterium]